MALPHVLRLKARIRVAMDGVMVRVRVRDSARLRVDRGKGLG